MMTSNEDEFRALRATIQQRGTARMVVVPLVFVGWAGTAVATAAVITVAISTLVPLLILVAGFESVFALHVNVERIGRYLQIFHEREEIGWEGVAARFSQRFANAGPDPLFGRLFVLATSVNFLPAALGWENIPELVVLAALHLLFINRIRLARTFAAAQREKDMERFETLRMEMRAQPGSVIRDPGSDRSDAAQRPEQSRSLE
jgi:hypothetical protein